ncbi:MAG: type 4a pilus biogenesis protein PilO [Nitrospira sp.]|nr:type 4a pilus biogenesis protein PilO [Nitrospira sp.]
MTDRLQRMLSEPYAPLLPWVGLAALLLAGLMVVNAFGVRGVEGDRIQIEKEWVSARQVLAQHREARKARKDVSQVWAVLPVERDFAPLALGISEEAKRDHVTLPALSYKTEATAVANTSKGVLQGSMTGRYEDLRRFIYDLETAEELLFIEDLELAGSSSPRDQQLTFNIKIVTYLRGESVKSPLGVQQ